MNPRPLGPEPARYQLRYTPERKRSSRAAAVWLGMRGSNSHGGVRVRCTTIMRIPIAIIVVGVRPQRSYYSVWETVCQQLFQTFAKICKKPKIRAAAPYFLPRLRAPTALAGGKDARVHLGHGHRQRPHRRAEHERDDGHVPYPLFHLVGGVVLITAGDA